MYVRHTHAQYQAPKNGGFWDSVCCNHPRATRAPMLYIRSKDVVLEAPRATLVHVHGPLSSEYGTYKIANAIFWPWPSGQSPQTLLNCLLFARKLPTISNPKKLISGLGTLRTIP